MRRVLAAVSLAAIFATPVAAGAKPAPGSSATLELTNVEAAAIYVAVLRDLLPTHPIDRDPRIHRVLVTDGAVDGAGSLTDHDSDPERSFSRRVKARIRRTFADDLPVLFVEDFSDRLLPRAKANEARMWVTLGPIRGTETRVEVGIEANAATPLGGMWKIDVVERFGRTWKVTGTTGPVAVS